MASCALLALVVGAALAAPIYADHIAETTPSDNHLSEQVEVDGETKDVVSLTGEPIGPTWQKRFLLGADENGRDLMVRLLYGIRTLRRHVLRNGLIPPVNLWGLDFSHAFGGFVLYVEVIFGLRGVGKLTADTLGGLDLPPIVGLAVFLAIVVVLTNAVVDVIVAWLDPRLRGGGSPIRRSGVSGVRSVGD